MDIQRVFNLRKDGLLCSRCSTIDLFVRTIMRLLVHFYLVLIAVTETSAKVALLIIDIQRCFLPGGSLAVTNGTQVIPVINNIRSQHQFAMTVLTQDWHCPNHVSFASQHQGHKQYEYIALQYSASGSMCSGSAGKCDVKYNVSQILWPDHCVINSTSAEFSPELTRKPSDIVVRKGYNCDVDSYSAFYDNGGFRQTELHTTLQSHGVTQVIVTGLALDYCVYYTAKDAKKLGYETYLVLDASRPVSKHTGDKAIADMAYKGVHIIKSSDLIKEVFGTSSADSPDIQFAVGLVIILLALIFA